MTVEEIEREVQRIKEIAEHDNEHAHAIEDRLHHKVMQYIAAEGHPLAVACLKSLNIRFNRWMA